LAGARWNRLVPWNHLIGAEMLCFSIREVSKIFIVMFNFDDGEKGDEEEDSDEGEEDPSISIIVSTRCYGG
jgi:hypothetical protein